MDAGSGEQITVSVEKMGEDVHWLIESMDIGVTLFNGAPIGVEVPSHVVLQIIASEPGIKGDTASGAQKPATLSTGAVINVPLFVKEGEWVKVDTREGTYLERVNKQS